MTSVAVYPLARVFAVQGTSTLIYMLRLLGVMVAGKAVCFGSVYALDPKI